MAMRKDLVEPAIYNVFTIQCIHIFYELVLCILILGFCAIICLQFKHVWEILVKNLHLYYSDDIYRTEKNN